MRKGQRIDNLFHVCFGLKTGDDEKFLHHTKGLHREDKHLLRGNDVKRYYYDYKGEYVWYVPSRMREHRNTARPGEAERFEQPKVLVKDTTADFAGTFDDNNFYVKDVLIIIPQDDKPACFDLRYVAGIINSIALKFYYRTTFQTIHVQCEELGSLPLPPIDMGNPAEKKCHDDIVLLAASILSLNKKLPGVRTDFEKNRITRQIESADRQIDELVYDLYGLTPEEIKIVEESTKTNGTSKKKAKDE